MVYWYSFQEYFVQLLETSLFGGFVEFGHMDLLFYQNSSFLQRPSYRYEVELINSLQVALDNPLNWDGAIYQSDFNYPDDVITSRVKIRGHGRSMRVKYESEQGKDFLLLGWGMIQGRNPRY